MAERKPFGKANGQDVQLAVLTNGRYIASIATYGATLVYYGTENYNAVLSHDSAEKYCADNNYMGMVVGPYANRIAGASFVLDGKSYQLEKNDNGNNLHSGSATYAHKVWRITGQSNTSVTMSLSTPEEGGFPGKHDTEITYILSEDGILTLSYKAVSSEKCPCALTNHAYFILDDEGARNTVLTLPADEYVAVDSVLIPTPETPSKVEGTAFDFREATRIGDRREGKYDNSWILRKNAVVHAEGNRAELWCRTTEPAIQVYTGEFLSGADVTPFLGLALETGRYPNTPNRPDFPQCFTEHGVVMESTTSYCLKVKD